MALHRVAVAVEVAGVVDVVVVAVVVAVEIATTWPTLWITVVVVRQEAVAFRVIDLMRSMLLSSGLNDYCQIVTLCIHFYLLKLYRS